jgi:hypothetical protein
MGGVFLGFLCALALLAFLGRLRTGKTPGGWLGAACWALVILTGLDGLNAFLYDGNLPHLYPPSTIVRLATGLAAGFGLGVMATPVVASTLWRHTEDEASIQDPLELGSGLALAGLAGGLILVGASPLLWPAAVAMLLAVLMAFGLANVYVLVLATGRVRQVATTTELNGLFVAGLGLSLLELAALSALRSWLIAAFGFTWGI